MRKFLLTIILLVSTLLISCNQDSELTTSFINEHQMKQRVIIKESVEAPTQPEAKNITLMPGKLEPQQIPNANLNNPIVITKMPYSD